MDLAAVLKEALAANRWPVVKMALEAEVSEQAVRAWLAGESIPNGRSIVVLERRVPGLRELLDAEFARTYGAAA